MSADPAAPYPRWAQRRWALLIILAVAIATRVVTFGNPLVDMDDQFYWLVGRSWWQGDWPIIDIWDRKPVGLFLLYAVITGVDRSILAVQIASLLFAAGTAFLIRTAALRIASPTGALLGALAYLLFLPVFWGQSGQSPVFYNLFIAAAAVLLLRASASVDAGVVRRHAFAAMLLSGLALVIKQVSVAEGVYFGVAFLYLLRRAGERYGRIALTGGLMIAVALLPSLAGAVLFLLRGEGAPAAYLHASYFSIFIKAPGAGTSLMAGLAYLLLFGGPLFIAVALGLAPRPQDERQRLAYQLVAGWIVAAVTGYLLVPNFFPHYALPLLVPLSVTAARAFDRPIGKLLFLALAFSCLMTGRMTDYAGNHRARHDFDQLVATIDRARQGGCIYVANGPVSLYTAAPDCGVTPYIFPYHLTLATESTAVGVAQQAEIARIFAARPAVVVTQDNKRKKQTAAVRATLGRHLAADYRLIGQFPADATDELSTLRIWQRKKQAQNLSRRPIS